MSIGERLREARKIRRISQDLLAEKIEMSRGVIANIEQERTKGVSIVAINAICDALKIRREWLLDGIGPMEMSLDEKREKILEEIILRMRKMSEADLTYILDVIKAYNKRIKIEQ